MEKKIREAGLKPGDPKAQDYCANQGWHSYKHCNEVCPERYECHMQLEDIENGTSNYTRLCMMESWDEADWKRYEQNKNNL